MSALGDLAAALLPPEAGGPPPERVATAARHLIDPMPAMHRAALGAGLVALEGIALARHGRTLGRLAPEQRADLLRGIAGAGSLGSGALDGMKTVVLMAAGASEYADEIFETANRHPVSRPDPYLAMADPGDVAGRRFDAVVVGSGAGGAFAARALARAGHEVLIVEEGERWTSERIRRSHPLDRFAGIYRDAGATVALGAPPIALPLGRAVGGTTVINSGTCFRPPAPVVEEWRDEHGFELAGDGLEERLADVEEALSVAPVPGDVMGRNGELALAGAARLGWRAGPLDRNAPGCRGACQCAIGCPNNAKAGVHLTALPQACEAGATILASARAERILVERGRAAGVLVRVGRRRRLRIPAGRVIVACGAIETPGLLRRSGLGDHPRLGRGLSIHPALGATGKFAEPVFAWHGVLQSAGIEELHERRGILLEATSTPPGMGAITTAGFGAELVERIAGSDRRASLGAMIADAPSGFVHGARRPTIVYRLSREDSARLREALGAIGRVLLAAGAEEVELGGGAPAVRDESELEAALEAVDPRSLHLAAFHPTGTAAAGGDPARHPVDGRGALRGVEGLWVADGSILPSCPGVNPQISIMSVCAGVGEAAANGR